MSGRELPDSGVGRLIMPGGHRGPVFLVTSHFDVIQKYNASDAYALAVAFLGEILAGRPAIVAPWPADEEMLDRDDAVRLQEMLRDRGLYDGAIDGLLGSGSRAAVARYQERHGLIADGHPDRTLMTHIEQNSVRATPPLQGWDSGRP